MIFKKNGDIVFEGADKVWCALVKEMHKDSWEKAIDYHISLRKQRKRKESEWSDDLVRALALFGLHVYCERTKKPPIKIPLDFYHK